jgi:hypothetical protein
MLTRTSTLPEKCLLEVGADRHGHPGDAEVDERYGRALDASLSTGKPSSVTSIGAAGSGAHGRRRAD